MTCITDTLIVEDGQEFKAVAPGSQFLYTIQLENLTENLADSIVITQILPPDVSFIESAISPTTVTANQITWILPTLESFAFETWPVNVRLNVDTPVEIDELVCFVSFICPNDSADINNSYTETARIIRPIFQYADVGVEITARTDTSVERSGTIYPAVFSGESYSYSIRVFNDGLARAESVRVIQQLPDGVTSLTQNPPSDNAENQSLLWFFPVLDMAQDTTIQVFVSG